MDTFGYSERGILNCFFLELQHSRDAVGSLQDLLRKCWFPPRSDRPAEFSDATVLMEQSYSDFGDADVTLLLDGANPQCIFIEAKVKTAGRATWRIEDEWGKFLKRLDEGKAGSNLFGQLHRKQRLIHLLKQRRTNAAFALPADVLTPCGSLGSNAVVRRAVDLIIPRVEHALYLAIVPEEDHRMREFLELMQTSVTDVTPVLADWDVGKWGFLTWRTLKTWCESRSQLFPHTLKNFEFNREQIYASVEPSYGDFRAGDIVEWNHDGITKEARVRRRGKWNSRVVWPDGHDKLVPNNQLMRKS